MYRLLRDEYFYTINYIDNTTEAANPSKEEKEQLNITSNIPILRVKGINYTEAGVRLFYHNDVYRSDEYSYNFRIYMNKDPM